MSSILERARATGNSGQLLPSSSTRIMVLKFGPQILELGARIPSNTAFSQINHPFVC